MLIEQLQQCPHAAHDDGPDALEMAVATAQIPVSIGPLIEVVRTETFGDHYDEDGILWHELSSDRSGWGELGFAR